MNRPFSFDAVPLLTSPPVLFQFSQTALLIAGSYEFVGLRSPLTPTKQLRASATYWFRTITASADVSPSDYSGALSVIPVFQLYTTQAAGGPFLNDGVQLGKYLDNLPYEYAYQPVSTPNSFSGTIVGKLDQTATLLGKPSITITIIVAAQEIMSDGFNQSLKMAYPKGGHS